MSLGCSRPDGAHGLPVYGKCEGFTTLTATKSSGRVVPCCVLRGFLCRTATTSPCATKTCSRGGRGWTGEAGRAEGELGGACSRRKRQRQEEQPGGGWSSPFITRSGDIYLSR